MLRICIRMMAMMMSIMLLTMMLMIMIMTMVMQKKMVMMTTAVLVMRINTIAKPRRSPRANAQHYECIEHLNLPQACPNQKSFTLDPKPESLDPKP